MVAEYRLFDQRAQVEHPSSPRVGDKIRLLVSTHQFGHLSTNLHRKVSDGRPEKLQ
jgi:hypothetical protein